MTPEGGGRKWEMGVGERIVAGAACTAAACNKTKQNTKVEVERVLLQQYS